MLNWIRRHRRLSITATLAAFLILFFVASLFVPVVREICSDAKQNYAKECVQYHLGPFVLVWIVTNADAHNGPITAIATALLFWVTARLVTLGHEQSETTRAQLRAYLALKHVAYYPIGPDGTKTVDSYNVEIVWENAGLTPARRCCSAINSLTIGPAQLPANFSFADHGPLPVGRSHLGPRQTQGSIINIPAQELKKSELGQCHIYVWAWIEYSDRFQNSPRRRTEVAFRITSRGDATQDGATLGNVHLSRFNAADEQCHRQAQTV